MDLAKQFSDFPVWLVKPTTRCQLIRRNTFRMRQDYCDCQRKLDHKCGKDYHPIGDRNDGIHFKNQWFPSGETFSFNHWQDCCWKQSFDSVGKRRNLGMSLLPSAIATILVRFRERHQDGKKERTLGTCGKSCVKKSIWKTRPTPLMTRENVGAPGEKQKLTPKLYQHQQTCSEELPPQK